jgi:hypothetical protein
MASTIIVSALFLQELADVSAKVDRETNVGEHEENVADNVAEEGWRHWLPPF